MESAVAFFIFYWGAIVGSFLNVCIVRMPKEESVVFPGSHCPSCQQAISWYDNIPLVSYFPLGGKCRFCRAKISSRYLIVEFLTAVLFLILYSQFHLSGKFFAYTALTSGLIAATFIDLEHRIIPDEISVNGLFVGIIFSLFVPSLHDTAIQTLGIGRVVASIFIGLCALKAIWDFIVTKGAGEDIDAILLMIVNIALWAGLLIGFILPWLNKSILKGIAPNFLSLNASLLGFLIGGACIYLLGLIGDFIFKKESMGGGDVKLLAMIGAFLGWKMVLLIFFIAPVFGAIPGIIIKIRTKESVIAYGPALAAAAFLCIFYGDAILKWFFRGYGLY